ncbi:hypothetical protein V8Z74_14815 [Comamonas sp. w2-DMI]|uniref:hypothetical protein n=1 Tax=Comamonas sp. w2-DMI TaxID=3126391 RepID=UPI0032E3EDE9
MEIFLRLVLLAIVLTPLLFGLYGLTKLLWRVVVHFRAWILDFLVFMSDNLAFTAFMVATTGVSLEMRAMPWTEKVQFAGTFLLLYILGKNLAKIRARLEERKVDQEK